MNDEEKPSKTDLQALLDESQTEARDRVISGVFRQFGWAIGSIFLALFVAGLIMLAAGFDPMFAYGTLLRGAFSNPDQILWRATPLIFTGLAVALAFKSGLFNIGGEGQLIVGGLAAAVIGFAISLPIVIHPILALVVGAFIGGLWGLIPGLLKAYRGAHEVVTTIMLNFIAAILTAWLVSGPLIDPAPINPIPQTPLVLPTAYLPNLFFSNFVHAGFFLALITALFVHYLLQKTVLGYEMRAVGFNPIAAETAGINSKWTLALTMALSGALAGLGGASEVLGTFNRYIQGFSPGYAFDGITVAVLGNNNPFGVLFGALFFGLLRAGSISMQVTANVPIEMIGVIQGLVILFVAAPKLVSWLARQGNRYARWLEIDWKNATPIFLTVLLAFVASIVGMIIVAIQMPYFIALAGIAFFAGQVHFTLIFALILTIIFILIVIGLVAFIGLMKGQRWATIATSLISLGLPVIALVNVVFLPGIIGALGIPVTPIIAPWENWLLPIGVIGLVGLIFSLLSFYLMRWKGVVVGGEF